MRSRSNGRFDGAMESIPRVLGMGCFFSSSFTLDNAGSDSIHRKSSVDIYQVAQFVSASRTRFPLVKTSFYIWGYLRQHNTITGHQPGPAADLPDRSKLNSSRSTWILSPLAVIVLNTALSSPESISPRSVVKASIASSLDQGQLPMAM